MTVTVLESTRDRVRNIFCTLVGMGILLYAHTAAAQTETRTALGAREVQELLHLSLGVHENATVLKLAVDGDKTPALLGANRVLVARRPVSLVYTDPNPFGLALSAGVESIDDPANAAVLRIIEGLAAIPPIIGAGSAAGDVAGGQSRRALFQSYGLNERDAAACATATEASRRLDLLRASLDPPAATPADLVGNLANWKNLLDQAGIPGGIGVRAKLIEQNTGVISLVTAESGTLRSHIEAATKLAAAIEAEVGKSPGNTQCDQLTRSLYSLAAMTQPRRRIGELLRIRNTLDDLASALTAFAHESRWLRSDQHLYVLTAVYPDSAKLQKVIVKAAELKYGVPDETSGVVVITGESRSGTFIVRRFDRWVTEVGAGLISAAIATPKYGTVERDGKTFAARVSEDRWSWSPAVVANFVCRCWESDKMAFMIQLGAVPNKDTPAVLGGIGARLLGGAKGGIGVSGGFVHAWVKELTDDFLANPISGTKDIEANKKFTEHWKPYFMIQYQF